jgi:hypothetical protein
MSAINSSTGSTYPSPVVLRYGVANSIAHHLPKESKRKDPESPGWQKSFPTLPTTCQAEQIFLPKLTEGCMLLNVPLVSPVVLPFL